MLQYGACTEINAIMTDKTICFIAVYLLAVNVYMYMYMYAA